MSGADAPDPGETVGLVVERRGAVAVLRLDRRDARNALTSALVSALCGAVGAADGSAVAGGPWTCGTPPPSASPTALQTTFSAR